MRVVIIDYPYAEGRRLEIEIDDYDTHKERVAYKGYNFWRTGRTHAGLRIYKFRWGP